ncbi:hypothetical protein ACVWZV_002187 [Bradyrhizobium sp. GM5.1]
MTTLLEDIAAQKHHANQDELVGKYLRENGQADRDFLYNIGLPPVGRILNPRGRIHELRAKGWEIETVEDGARCYYKLINAPAEKPDDRMSEKKPRITIMGEEVPWDELPSPGATELADHFKPVKLSPKALDQASKIIPQQFWISKGCGLHTFLKGRAEKVFAGLTSGQTEGQYGTIKYFFEFDSDGPVLRSVSV